MTEEGAHTHRCHEIGVESDRPKVAAAVVSITMEGSTLEICVKPQNLICKDDL